jgi:ribosomal-protein-alanine N-acetyltransferase
VQRFTQELLQTLKKTVRERRGAPPPEHEIFQHLPPLETPRLLLRKLMLTDAEDVFVYAADPMVSRYVLWTTHETRSDSIAFVKNMVRKYEQGEACEWALVYKETHTVIGTCGFVGYSQEHACAEVGYALAKHYWRQGIMQEALLAVFQFAFSQLGINRLEARCLVPNVASQKTLERAGMRFEGILRDKLNVKGRFEDVKYYAILRNEFASRFEAGMAGNG